MYLIKKILALCLLPVLLLLPACRKGKKQSFEGKFIGGKLDAERTYLHAHAAQLKVEKTVTLNGKTENKADSAKAAINILDILIDIDPDRVISNKASFLTNEKVIQDSAYERHINIYTRKPGEHSPINMIQMEQRLDNKSQHPVWYSFELSRDEDNTLFKSNEDYILHFEGDHLQSIETRHFEKNKATDPVNLVSKIIIKQVNN